MAPRILTLLVFFVFIKADAQLSSQTEWKVVQDSVTVPASTRYSPASFLKKFLMGANYRELWAEPVKLPVFHLKEKGLVIKELGGGMQTRSLQMIDKHKVEWVLRSVDKYVQGKFPKPLRNPLIENFAQEMISASHPYAPLTVGYLARAAGIVAPNPTIYFVPDDPAFGQYQSLFANTVCMLERREPTPDKSETENTAKVLEKIVEENDHLVLQKTVLKARLLDMLVADWDRHADQWRWGVIDSGKTEYYYAIPRDRDQAFFMGTGLLPRIVKAVAMPYANSFKRESKNLKALNFKSRQFDRIFLNELDAEAWKKITAEFQSALSDNVIDAAAKRMPPEIYALNGPAVAAKLKSRRDGLLENVMKYYRHISGMVTINGTEEAELFEISEKDKKLMLSVFRYEANKAGKKIYERTFDADETGSIYLVGWEGNDRFHIADNVQSKIKVHIKGGAGDDVYDMRGSVRNVLYDSDSDNNTILNKSASKVRFVKPSR